MKVPTRITPNTRRSPEGQGFLRAPSTAGLASQAALGDSLSSFGNTLGNVGQLFQEQAKQARRFGTMQNYNAFQEQVNTRLTELQRTSNPATGNYADIANATYNNMEVDFLKTVDEDLHDEFATMTSGLKQNVARNSLAFQYESTDNFFRQGIQDQLDVALQALDQDGSIPNLDTQRATIDSMIDGTTLTEAEKVAIRRKAYSAIEGVSYKSEVRRGNLDLGALGVGSAPGRAVDLILEFDGPAMENGLDYETNRQLLGERVKEAEQVAVKAVGSVDRWAALPERARAVLISLADDLGEIPESVDRAIASGDLNEVANAIADLGGSRRTMESNIIVGTDQMPEGILDRDPRFANISYEDRLALRADAEREAAQDQAAEVAAAKAAQAASINELMLNIYDGQSGQYEIDQARESGVLTDFNDVKAAQELLKKRDGDLIAVQEIQSMIASGVTGNPADEDFRKAFNAYIGEAGEAQLKARNGDYVTQILIPAARQLGDLPTNAVGQLTAMTRSQDPQQAMFALDSLSQLQQASPEAYQARVSEAQQADVEYWQSVKDYYPLQEVLSSVRGGDTQEERVRNETRRKDANELINKGDIVLNGTDVGVSGGFFGFGSVGLNPQAAPALSADYQQLFIREYQRDGNVNAAKQRAANAIKKIWRPTTIGGQSTLMKYPPELVGYETWDGSHDWMTEQGKADLGITQNFQLLSDAQTQSEFQDYQSGGAQRPSYLVTYFDDSGNLTMPFYTEDEAAALGDARLVGTPKRLSFEITPEMQAIKAEQHAVAQRQSEYDDFMTTYNKALAHSVKTGLPVPEEMQEDFEAWEAEFPQRPNPLLVFESYKDR